MAQVVKSYLELPIYVPLATAIAALNSFIPFFPVEIFLILRILVRPKEWLRNAVFAGVASAAALVCLAHLVEFQPHDFLVNWMVHHFSQSTWDRVSQFVNHRGSIGLFFVAVSFFPLPPAVIVCALSKVPDWEIFLSIGLGNCLKYGFFSWLAVRAPLKFSEPATESISL